MDEGLELQEEGCHAEGEWVQRELHAPDKYLVLILTGSLLVGSSFPQLSRKITSRLTVDGLMSNVLNIFDRCQMSTEEGKLWRQSEVILKPGMSLQTLCRH